MALSYFAARIANRIFRGRREMAAEQRIFSVDLAATVRIIKIDVTCRERNYALLLTGNALLGLGYKWARVASGDLNQCRLVRCAIYARAIGMQ